MKNRVIGCSGESCCPRPANKLHNFLEAGSSLYLGLTRAEPFPRKEFPCCIFSSRPATLCGIPR